MTQLVDIHRVSCNRQKWVVAAGENDSRNPDSPSLDLWPQVLDRDDAGAKESFQVKKNDGIHFATQIKHQTGLVTSDLRVRLQAAIRGIGIALLPEQVIATPLKEGLVGRVLSEWSGAKNILHLVYSTPRGMLPSVRSLIDYLLVQVPVWLQGRSIRS
jgi:DNA-binding transcriptional LysR family regulator